jgi:NADPH:quinone reductase-like Zn-dependent oxidoreductase
MRKRGRISSSTLRSRAREEKEDVLKRLEGHALPLLERGELTVPVEEIFPLDQAQEAYDRFAAGGKFGKIVITP